MNSSPDTGRASQVIRRREARQKEESDDTAIARYRKQQIAAENRHIGRVMESVFKEEIEENAEAAIEKYLTKDESVKHMYLKLFEAYNAKKKRNDSTHVFLTITPREETTLVEIMKVMKKVTSKVWMKDYIYSIEQRGTVEEDNLGKGKHMHILFRKGSEEPCKIIREVRNTCKHIIGNAQNCDFQFRTADKAKNYPNYIKGIKKDKEKEAKCEGDRIWRVKNNIEQFYEKGEVFSE